MGGSTWNVDDWKTYSATTTGKATDKIFKSKNAAPKKLSPIGVVRESR